MPLQLIFAMPDEASEELEALLAKQVCPQHPGTTIGASDRCAICDLDDAMFRAGLAEQVVRRAPWIAMAMAD